MQLYLCHGLVGECSSIDGAMRISDLLILEFIAIATYILACHGGECVSIDVMGWSVSESITIDEAMLILELICYNYILACHAGECISIDEVCNLLIFGSVTCIASGHIELIALR